MGFHRLCGLRRIFRYPECTSASLVKVNHDLGLPQYLMPFPGTVKILGAITILLQPLKRFHEAAYAGFVFYFSGATYVLIANGNGIDKYGTTLFIILAVVVSYLRSLLTA